jgi:hypothetical protein
MQQAWLSWIASTMRFGFSNNIPLTELAHLTLRKQGEMSKTFWKNLEAT